MKQTEDTSSETAERHISGRKRSRFAAFTRTVASSFCIENQSPSISQCRADYRQPRTGFLGSVLATLIEPFHPSPYRCLVTQSCLQRSFDPALSPRSSIFIPTNRLRASRAAGCVHVSTAHSPIYDFALLSSFFHSLFLPFSSSYPLHSSSCSGSCSCSKSLHTAETATAIVTRSASGAQTVSILDTVNLI